MFSRKPRFIKGDIDSVIAACIIKDQGAEKELIRMFLSYAKSICLRYSSNKMESEEIQNDGFLKVFTNLSKYDHSQPFKAWFRTIMVNTAIDYYRKSQRYSEPMDIEDLEIIDISVDIISRIEADEIMKLVQRLPPAYKMVFTLYVVDGYNHREIAEMLGIKEGTSKSNLQDARKKLQMMIKNLYPQLHLAYGIKFNKVNEN